MARSDRAAFLGVLRQAEGELTALFEGLATEVGNLVLRAQDPDGSVPLERLPELRAQVARLVDARFVGAGREPFDERNGPESPYAQIISDGQWAMVELALEREARILDRYLPEDLRQALAARRVRV